MHPVLQQERPVQDGSMEQLTHSHINKIKKSEQLIHLAGCGPQ